MKLVSKFELATYTLNQLRGIYMEILAQLSEIDISDQQYLSALTSLENIKREYARRTMSYDL